MKLLSTGGDLYIFNLDIFTVIVVDSVGALSRCVADSVCSNQSSYICSVPTITATVQSFEIALRYMLGFGINGYYTFALNTANSNVASGRTIVALDRLSHSVWR